MGLPKPSTTLPRSPGPTFTRASALRPQVAQLQAFDFLERYASTRPLRNPISCVRMGRPPEVVTSQKSPTAALGRAISIRSPTTSVTSPVQRKGEIRIEVGHIRSKRNLFGRQFGHRHQYSVINASQAVGKPPLNFLELRV